jgi:diguanylate cyclase (GGDEF)-like protein/PAS domain S-box-containing protein
VILQKSSDSQIAQSENVGNVLTRALRNTTTLSVILLVIAVVIALLVGGILIRSINPISMLANIIKGASLDNIPRVQAELSNRADEVGHLASVFNEMGERLRTDIQKRKIAEKKFETLFESSSDAILIVDQEGVIRFFNKQAETMFGFDKPEILGKAIEQLMPERFRKGHLLMRLNFMEQPQQRTMSELVELQGLRKDGSEFPVDIGLAPIETDEGMLISVSIRDVTERKKSEMKLIHQASYDQLTGLPNRVLALDRLSHAISSATRQRDSIAVMFIDLDNFKQVNDSLGHTVGDKLLEQVGHRLADTVRANDTVARLGGDEFLVIVPHLKELNTVEVVAEKLIEAISKPYAIDERELYIGASIGITIFPTDSDEPEVLLRNADAAMYQAKDAGRNTFRFFTQEMNEQLLYRLEIESQLRHAVENNELFLAYQPLYDLANNEIAGVEALLRWNNPKLGPIDPESFISIAEETGLINKMGEWILREACHNAMVLHNHVKRWLRISVNISATQFRGGDLVTIVKNALDSTGLPPEYLELEITERVLIDDNLNVSRIIQDLKRLGVRLALDDFGTGYSSLGYLKRFQFDVLKIDRIFVSDVTRDPETDALCKAIVAMADSLNLTVVGEGVENQQQFQFLRDLGIDLVQGFYLSKPVSNDEIIKLLNRRNILLSPVQ